MLKRKNKAQSLIEYAVVFSVVVAAILIMQAFIKRGYQGSLKDSADKMGEQFSAGNTTISQNRSLNGTQTILHEAGTTGKMGTVLGTLGLASNVTTHDLTAQEVYSVDTRTGGKTTAETKVKTDAATKEATRWSDYNATEQTNFPAPFSD